MTNKPITPALRQFLDEFAKLLEAHRTTFCAVADSSGYETTVTGIEFYQESEWDDEHELTRDYSEAALKVGTTEVDAEWLRKLTSELP